jgi:CheY-like chemotaxis protein
VNTTASTILVVEDDQHDAFFIKRALQKTRPDLSLQFVNDGEQALNYLHGHSKYADRATYPLPALIFLDLKLPYFSGFQILEHIRSNPALAAVPVFVLTSSPEDRDRRRALELGARAYLIKPPTPQMLLEVLDPMSAASPKANRPSCSLVESTPPPSNRTQRSNPLRR